MKKNNNDIEIIQVNISGDDKPGLTAALTGILAKYDAFILDIGQANIHQTLTLGILFKTTPQKSGFIMKDLIFAASELGVQIRFSPVSRKSYKAWVGRQGKGRYIATLLGRVINASDIARITEVTAKHGFNIDAIRRLTGRMPLDGHDPRSRSCIEFSLRGHVDDQTRIALQKDIMNCTRPGLDVSFQQDDIYRRSRRLICFDMDSTLVGAECIDELAVHPLQLTGRYVGEVVDGRRKAELLRLLCQFEGINIAQSVAVGDGANDLPMIGTAGLGIAYHAKPKVKATAEQNLSTVGLDGILYFLGLKDSQIEG